MKNQIKEAMMRAFGFSDVSQVPDNATINALREWDSVAHLMLILELENEFKIKIPSDAMLDLLSLEDIENFLVASQTK